MEIKETQSRPQSVLGISIARAGDNGVPCGSSLIAGHRHVGLAVDFPALPRRSVSQSSRAVGWGRSCSFFSWRLLFMRIASWMREGIDSILKAGRALRRWPERRPMRRAAPRSKHSPLTRSPLASCNPPTCGVTPPTPRFVRGFCCWVGWGGGDEWVFSWNPNSFLWSICSGLSGVLDVGSGAIVGGGRKEDTVVGFSVVAQLHVRRVLGAMLEV